MKLFHLNQKEYSDFTTPDKVNQMLISGYTEQQTRGLAKINEIGYRDNKQQWTSSHATCKEIILPENNARVFLVS